MFENNIEGKECNNFMKILLLDSYLKIKGLNIYGCFDKKFVKSNSISSNSSQFQERGWGMKIWDFKGYRKEWVFPSTHSISFHLNSKIRKWTFHSLLPNESLVFQVFTSLSSLCLSLIHSFVPFFLSEFHTLFDLTRSIRIGFHLRQRVGIVGWI